MELINQTLPNLKFREFRELVIGDIFLWVSNNDIIDYENIWIKTDTPNGKQGITINKADNGRFIDENKVILLRKCKFHYELEQVQ